MSVTRAARDRRAEHKAALDRIVETVIYLQTESRRLAKEQCARHGITATQLNVLKMLQAVGDLSLSELSRRMAAKNSTITGIIDRLVDAELVEREQSATDRRVWKIKLAPNGKALADKIEIKPWEILRHAVMQLPPDELDNMIHSLLRVVNYVELVVGKDSK
jgi:DNA-binding MarR family transcriptional regulator